MAKKKTVKKVPKKETGLEESSGEVTPKKLKQLENKQLAGILGIIVFIFALFLGTYYYHQYKVNHPYIPTFDYVGVKWEETKLGDIDYWHSVFKLKNGTINGKPAPVYNAWLTHDPRSLMKYPVEGNLTVRSNAVISKDISTISCGPQATHTSLTQGFFLIAVNIDANATYTDKERAEIENREPISCENSSEDLTVYVLKIGNRNVVLQNQDYPNCFEFVAEDCDSLIGIGERFIVGVLEKVSGQKG